MSVSGTKHKNTQSQLEHNSAGCEPGNFRCCVSLHIVQGHKRVLFWWMSAVCIEIAGCEMTDRRTDGRPTAV